MISQILWLSTLTDSVQELLTTYDSEATLQDFLNFAEARQLTMQTPILTAVQKYGEALENGSWPVQKSPTIPELASTTRRYDAAQRLFNGDGQ
jgi:hypothetical protein